MIKRLRTVSFHPLSVLSNPPIPRMPHAAVPDNFAYTATTDIPPVCVRGVARRVVI